MRKSLKAEEEVDVEGQKVLINRKIRGNQVFKTIRFPHRTYEERVKLYSHEEIQKMLEDNGLEIVDCWGDYKGDKEGERQLFLVRKPNPCASK